MPDPILFLKAAAAAGAIAAIFILLGNMPWKSPRSIRASLSQILAIAIAFGVGCWLLDVKLDWSTDDNSQSTLFALPGTSSNYERLLVIVAPAVFLTEVFAVLLGRFRALAWIPRLAIAALTARVIMDGCIYIKDWDGPGSAIWKPNEIYMYFGILGAVLAAVWVGLSALARRPAAWSVPLSLAIACGCASINMLVTSISEDGKFGVPLSGALVGTAIVIAIVGKSYGTGAIGFGAVVLFAMLVVGMFFGKLSVTNAAIIFGAPTLGWLTELPRLNKLKPIYRGMIRVALTAAPIVVVVGLASRQALKDFNAPSANPSETNEADWYK